ncbi:MAG: exodeoxyribonuclease VII small subunit [Actinomycetota bacterium]|nr:exodeoxyribonuclease VII small subunit [Actinomycetota bacterium]MDG2120539.1 exodeoxyribonuclease VII small subunit [Actinomycetota bacterium]
MTNDEQSYVVAISKIEEILRSLDTENVDIDRLATDVQKAADLIAFCRDRLTAAQTEVERIVSAFD